MSKRISKEQFDLLMPEVQEKFINDGGLIISDGVIPVAPSETQSATKVTDLSTSSVIAAKESLNSPIVDLEVHGFDIPDPVDLLLLLDDDIANGRVKLYDWQIQYLLDFAKGGVTDEFPFQSLVRACNGSGKDKYIIAPCAVWLCMRYFRSRCVVTSSSGFQLDNQTCVYIELLCKSANAKFGPIWKINYRYFECLATESPISCFATDEPGKAEGFHPQEFGRKMGLFESEAKTVPDQIYVAQNKCTGYTHRALVSTPGLPMGHFFDLCNTSIDRKDIKNITDVKPGDYIQFHITAFDCLSHLRKTYIEQMKRDLPGGEHGAAYKSQVLAEFGTTDEQVVIPYKYVYSAFHKADDHWVKEEHNKGGLDLSDGGDETVLVVRNGNKVIAIEAFRFDNTEDTIEHLYELFKKHKLVHSKARIFADCGGLGKPMLNHMKRQGWSNIYFVDNRSKPFLPKTYKNRGAEMWFKTAEFFKQGDIIIPKDDRLTRQLSTRYFKTDGQIHQLLSKPESRSRGFPSPDRADALVLAFTDFESSYTYSILEEKAPITEEEIEEQEVTPAFDMRSWAKDSGDYRHKMKLLKPSNLSDIEEAISEYNSKLTKG